MVVLETKQIEDHSGHCNLYILEIAERFIPVPWGVHCIQDVLWMNPGFRHAELLDKLG